MPLLWLLLASAWSSFDVLLLLAGLFASILAGSLVALAIIRSNKP